MAYEDLQFDFKQATLGRHKQYVFKENHFFIAMWNSLNAEQREIYNRLVQKWGQSGFIIALAINKRLSMTWKVWKQFDEGKITKEYALWLVPQLEGYI